MPQGFIPLPRIDALIDSTSGCELMSFLDAFQGYNQIRLADEDQEKTSFVTDQGIFCYNVMPFGLKNAGATYQRLVNNMFREQIGKNMEVYIDDMLVKSKRKEDHTQDLQACFDILQRNEAPRNIREVQRLTGRLAALNRFISRSSDKGLPFFKVLKNIKNFQWTPECQQAFEKLKEYLTSLPLLTKPKEGEHLYLYLATSQGAVSAVLTRAEARSHQPVYYVSKTLQGAEERYPPIEKLAFSLVVAARKLRHYFQSHPVVVLTNYPLKQVLAEPNISGRMVKWAVELSEHGIEYRPRPAIKAQALADFMVELMDEEKRPVNRCGSYSWMGRPPRKGAGQGDFEAKEKRMAQYLDLIRTFGQTFEKFELKRIPRSENEEADQLAKLASSLTIMRDRSITLLTQEHPEIEEVAKSSGEHE
ncbi:UNVERIFIED_CONTAM: Retrovirus-related Pol polyprotein from transposon opus [Sesamum radiatum]|uniref:Retrovirus-related Pol polyprotein from transposon opus n=1 Tax=Sesamum radiatum TaxID=300843 RepID=A0AAW2KB06_SESRA